MKNEEQISYLLTPKTRELRLSLFSEILEVFWHSNEHFITGMDPPGVWGGGVGTPNWGPYPSWGVLGGGGVKIFTKMCKKTKVLLKNE